MRECTSYVSDGLLNLNDVIFIEIHCIFLTQFLFQAIRNQEPRKDPNNRRLNEHGIYIQHCQESNSRPVPSQAGADTTRPQ